MAEDFSIKQIEMELNKLRGQSQVNDIKTNPAQGEDFGKILKDAISEVNELTKSADEGVGQQLIAGETTDLPSTIIQIQKADVSFQAMMQIRNKILKAYEEIIRMPM
jgi:flagellar hook-basal body complex protein FliE